MSPSRHPSPEEIADFHAAVADARPLKTAERITHERAKPSPRPRQRELDEAAAVVESLHGPLEIDDLLDHAYEIFLELASDNLSEAQIALFNAEFADRGALRTDRAANKDRAVRERQNGRWEISLERQKHWVLRFFNYGYAQRSPGVCAGTFVSAGNGEEASLGV